MPARASPTPRPPRSPTSSPTLSRSGSSPGRVSRPGLRVGGPCHRPAGRAPTRRSSRFYYICPPGRATVVMGKACWQALHVRMRLARDARGVVAFATVTALIGWAVLFAHSATAAPITARAAEAVTAQPADGSSAYDWPELHLDPQLGGYAANGTVSTANAAGLGVRWATDLYGAILDSPVIAYDPASGQTLGYVGTDAGHFYAINMATGAIVWAVKLVGPVQASPLVSDGAVWVATRSSPTIYKLDASTGAIDCSHPTHSGMLFSSPVAATPPGGTASVYFALPRNSGGGEVLSVSAATCATQWSFSGYQVAAGTWDPLAYAVDALGEPLVLFGSSDPDGVAYVPGKDGFVFALDLTTGAELWTASLGSQGGTPNESLSTAALDGTNLVV